MKTTSRILSLAALAAVLAASTAHAAPGIGDGFGAPAPAPALDPLPTLVPPANDDFDSRETASGLPHMASLSTAEATTAADDPAPAGCLVNAATVWYAYTAPITTPVTADTFGSTYDTCIAVFTGSRGSLVEAASNDDSGGGSQSQVSFLASGGVAYAIMVAGGPGGGDLQFTLDVDPPLGQIAVRATAASEARPAADADHLAWTQATRTSRRWTLYVQPQGEPRTRVNRARTEGYSGGFEGQRFVYQEVRGRQSNLWFFNLATGNRSVPAGVNTGGWEWHPTVSGDRLLFARHNFGTRTDTIVLRNLATGSSAVLDRLRTSSRAFSESGQVNGDYAVWYRCTPLCNVFVRDLAAGQTTKIANPNGLHQYDPSVTSDGTVYFARSRSGCGNGVTLVRQPLAGPRKTLAALPARHDSQHTFALENGDGTTTVLFDRINCRRGGWDVLKVIDP